MGINSTVAGGGTSKDGDEDAGFITQTSNISAEGTDDLLDEIDGLLESNAEDFIRSYVQKGGQ